MRHPHPLLLAAACVALALLAAACGGDDDAASGRTGTAAAPAPAATPTPDASVLLAGIVLQPDDVGAGFQRVAARARTNDELAQDRPDATAALAQFDDWGQVLAYNVQYAAPASPETLLAGQTTRVLNTATLFGDAAGAAASLDFLRDLEPSVVASLLAGEGAGAEVAAPRVEKDIGFPARGDESFAWRVSGEAALPSGVTLTFVADVVFVRAGAITGTIATVAFGQPPDRAELERHVDLFLGRAEATP